MEAKPQAIEQLEDLADLSDFRLELYVSRRDKPEEIAQVYFAECDWSDGTGWSFRRYVLVTRTDGPSIPDGG